MGGDVKRRAQAGAANSWDISLSWVERAFLLTMLRQTTVKGVRLIQASSQAQQLLAGTEDWSCLDKEGTDLMNPPAELAQIPPLPVTLTRAMVDLFIDEIIEKIEIRGKVATVLANFVGALDAMRKGEYGVAQPPATLS